MSDSAVSFDFEQLEPSNQPPRDAAERLLAEAAAEAEQLREQARREGHAEGRAAGLADSSEAVGEAVAALEQGLRGVQALRAEAVDAVEHDAIELAFALAAKILAGALQARPELVLDVVQGALRRVNDRRHMTVIVNPSDLDTVKAAIVGAGDGGPVTGLELGDLQPDERVGVGGAIVRTAAGEVDATVETQLERAREAVCAALEGPPEQAP